MIVQVGAQSVSVQVQSSGLGRATAAATAAAASAVAAAASAASAASTLAGAALKANNLSDLASASSARTNLGLGSIATQAASGVAITGGSVTGITDIAVADGGTGASTAAAARTNLGVVIGADVQAYDPDLTTWAAITPGTGVGAALAVAIGSAGAPVLFNGAGGTPSSMTLTNATALPVAGITSSTSTALGVGSLELGHATDTTLTRLSAGNVGVEGNLLYRAGGTDVPVADGGTGSSTAADARTALAVVGLTDLAASTGAALVGSIQTGTGVAARTVQAKLRDVFSVKDFGVVGDGTNETTTIQAAIDAVAATNGGILVFPPCSSFYGFTSLTIGNRVILQGQGYSEYVASRPSAYLKRFTGSTGVGITVTGDNSGFDKLHIDGDDLGTDLVVVNGGRFILRDTSLVQAGRDNLRIGSDTTSNTFNMNLWRVFNLISLDAGRYGFHIHDAKSSLLPDVNAGLLVGCDIRGAVNHGIYFEQAWDCNLYGVTCQNNGGTGLRYGALSRNITAIAPYLEANGNNEFRADAGNQFSRIIGNRSGINTSGYVDSTTNGVDMLQTRNGITGFYHHRHIRVANFAAGEDATVALWADTNENQAGSLNGRAGAVGSSGAMAIQVKRNGNTPIDRFLFTDGTAGPAANTAFVITTSTTPASASATGVAGTIAWDTSYIYVCTATDTWKRVAVATW